jgi:hypothetical protein
MMTPKEKAIELVEKFMIIKQIKLSDYSKIYLPTAKECALICCDEILGDMGADRGYAFWTEVKQEIEKL